MALRRDGTRACVVTVPTVSNHDCPKLKRRRGSSDDLSSFQHLIETFLGCTPSTRVPRLARRAVGEPPANPPCAAEIKTFCPRAALNTFALLSQKPLCQCELHWRRRAMLFRARTAQLHALYHGDGIQREAPSLRRVEAQSRVRVEN
ncbi:hypothetical protein SKAU_G00243850 [Synaphobranchus kaupii]|uniref:Uncharacterized protein n=1 Tax=Synaphobranchus kaupii TaxID=118154 RepID=A0A9Q1F816_SYNKA|nr:hypothetical protein SKAU_G00243850 [Synaphobranchus kaupii]